MKKNNSQISTFNSQFTEVPNISENSLQQKSCHSELNSESLS